MIVLCLCDLVQMQVCVLLLLNVFLSVMACWLVSERVRVVFFCGCGVSSILNFLVLLILNLPNIRECLWPGLVE